MKAMALTGLRKLEMQNVPEPVLLKETDVLLKMEAVGICGSDIHYYTEGKIGDQVINFPFIIGHECSSRVIKAGSKVKSLKPGDLVAIEPAVSCGHCDQCLSGRPHTCRSLKFLGCPGQLEGCMAEYLIMPEENCILIKDKSLSPAEAALVEPLSIGCYAAGFPDYTKVKTIGVLGTGPIGLSVIVAAKNLGARKVYATDKINSRLKIAQTMGAGWTGNPDELNIEDEIKRNEPLLLDAVFECCGKQEALDQALDILKPGGTLLIVGIPAEDRISFDISKLRRKEINIQNVRRQNHSVQNALDLLISQKDKITQMITHTFPVENAREAFDLVANYDDGIVKAIIDFDKK